MKKIICLLMPVLLVGLIFWQKNQLIDNYRFLVQSPCDTPITYRIGLVDSRYQLEEGEFLKKVQQAAGIWNQSLGKDLLAADPAAKLVINLLYTERQSALDKVERLEGEIQTGKKSLEKSITEYEGLLADFKVRMEEFNRQVASWNQQGGAPPGIYEELIGRQSKLKAEADRLNILADQLDLSVQEYNFQVGELNQGIEEYNLAVQKRPEAGIFDSQPPKIDIYLTISDLELIHTLAHEFGHVLGLDHFGQPEAIMYPFSSEVIRPTSEEAEFLKTTCETNNFSVIFAEKKAAIKDIIRGWKLSIPY